MSNTYTQEVWVELQQQQQHQKSRVGTNFLFTSLSFVLLVTTVQYVTNNTNAKNYIKNAIMKEVSDF